MFVYLWHLGIWFRGDHGDPGLTVGLDDPKVFSSLKDSVFAYMHEAQLLKKPYTQVYVFHCSELKMQVFPQNKTPRNIFLFIHYKKPNKPLVSSASSLNSS